MLEAPESDETPESGTDTPNRTILTGMVVTALRAEQIDITTFGDITDGRGPQHVLGVVTATLKGHGITLHRHYPPDQAPHIGQRITITLGE